MRDTTLQGDPVFNVRIVEQYGRERVLAEFHKVTKREALVMIGAAMSASLSIGGERTWVAPAVFVQRYGRTGRDSWIKQSHEVKRKSSQAYAEHVKFWSHG